MVAVSGAPLLRMDAAIHIRESVGAYLFARPSRSTASSRTMTHYEITEYENTDYGKKLVQQTILPTRTRGELELTGVCVLFVHQFISWTCIRRRDSVREHALEQQRTRTMGFNMEEVE